jgi:hypothetical protein
MNTGLGLMLLYFLFCVFGKYNKTVSSNPHILWVPEELVVSVVFGVWHFMQWLHLKPA